MDVVAVIAAITSVAGALASVFVRAQFERSRQRAQRRQDRQDLADRYSQPLLAAASSLTLAIGNADPREVQAFSRDGDQAFMLLGGEQWALGELMDDLIELLDPKGIWVPVRPAT